MKIPLFILMTLLILVMQPYANAAIRSQVVEYRDGDTVLEGYFVYDETIKEKVPVVIIVHEWMGLGSYMKKRAEQIAGLGYAARCEVY